MQQAKIQLSADIKGFKRTIDDAKKALVGLGSVKMSSESAKKLKEMFGTELQRSTKEVASKIKSVNAQLENMAKSNAFDPKKANQLGAALGNLKKQFEELNKLKKDLNKDGFKLPGAGGGEGGGGGGVMGLLKGGFGKIITTIGTVMGAGAAFSKRNQMAGERLGIRAISNGEIGSERSSMGFTPEERRSRMLGVAQAAGKNISGKELTSLSDMGERAERAYGISADQSNSAMGAARKGGGEGGKYLSNTIGAAVAAHLEGSRIGEFLSASTSALEKMGEGVNIDTQSLNGFAASLSSMPFFKSDPQRAFAALQNLDQMFKGGDRFQQAQASRAINNVGGGNIGPAAVEIRRQMGLFGGGEQQQGLSDRISKLNGGRKTGLSKAVLEDGGSIIKSMVKEAKGQTAGMGTDDRIYEIMSRLGLHGQEGVEVATSALEGKDIDEKQFKNAQMTPEDRLQKTFENADGSIKDLASKIEALKEAMATKIADPMTKLGHTLEKLLGAGGGDAVDRGANIGAGAFAATAVAGIGGAKIAGGIAKAGKGILGRLIKAGAKGGAKGAGKAGGRMLKGGLKASRALPLIGELVSAGFAIKDAWDIGEKLLAGQKVSWADYGELGLDVAGIFDPTGLTGVASVGLAAYRGMSEDSGDTLPENSPGSSMNMPPPGGGMPAAPGTDSTSLTPATGGSGVDLGDHKGAVDENTKALMALTAVMTGGGGAGGYRTKPRGAQMAPEGRAVGK